MGGGESKVETKTVESTGHVNNNLVIQEPVPIQTDEIIILLCVIAVIKILELGIFVYKQHVKGIKKKYNNDPKA